MPIVRPVYSLHLLISCRVGIHGGPADASPREGADGQWQMCQHGEPGQRDLPDRQVLVVAVVFGIAACVNKSAGRLAQSETMAALVASVNQLMNHMT
ncbi:hypothetical protein MRX96_039875 [Rhipicephalus microplus]